MYDHKFKHIIFTNVYKLLQSLFLPAPLIFTEVIYLKILQIIVRVQKGIRVRNQQNIKIIIKTGALCPT